MNEDSLREAFSKYGEVVESKSSDLFRVLVYVIAVVCMVLLLT